MASVKLTFDTNFTAASKEIVSGIKYTDKELKALDKTVKKFDAKNFDEFINKSKRLNAAVTLTKGPMAGLISQQRLLSRELEKGVKAGLDPSSKSLAKLRNEYQRVSVAVDTMRKADNKANAARKAALITQKKQAALLKSMGGTMIRYAKYAIVGVTIAAIAMGAGFVKAAAGIEDAEAAFRPMLGSLEKAHYLVGMINKTAATTPFQFDALADSAKQLLPAVQGSMKGVISTIRMLGDTASGNAQRLDSVTRAYTKSLLRGRVDMRSMNMIAKAGVPIYTELAKSMNVSVEELFSLSRVGKITAKDLTAAFKTMTAEGGLFFNGMKIASETLTGRISTLRDNFLFLEANIGKVMLPLVKNFVELLLYVVKGLREMTSTSDGAVAALTGLGAMFSTVGIALVGFIALVAGAVIGTETFTAAVGVLWAVITAHPIGALLTALALLVPAILFVAYNWEYVSKRFKIEVDFMSTVVSKLGSVISDTLEMAFLDASIAVENWGLSTLKYLTKLAIKFEEFKESMMITDIAKAPYREHVATLTSNLVTQAKASAAVIARLKKQQAGIDNSTINGVEGTIDSLIKSFQVRTAALAKLHMPKQGTAPEDANVVTPGDSFSKILESSIDDSTKRANLKQINDLKAYYSTRLSVERVGVGKEKDFILSEMNRLLANEKLHGQELINVKTAANDLILSMAQKHAKKLVKVKTDGLKELRDKTAQYYDDVAKMESLDLAELLANVDEGVNEEIAVYEQLATANDSITKRIIDSTSMRFKAYQDLVSQTTDKLIEFVHTGKMAWNDLLQTILEGMLRVKATQMFEGMFSGLLFGGAVTGANATIPMTTSGISLPGFAVGGIITSPTIAHVAEKGPEAVVPLVRKNGVLGLAQSSTSGSVNVTVINNSSAEVSTSTTEGPDGMQQIEMMIVDSVNQAGYNGKLNKMMKQSFNVSPSGVRR